MEFQLQAPFIPMGDQPEAIKQLVDGIRQGYRDQVLLGGQVLAKHLPWRISFRNCKNQH